jgi:hypothetical protein
MSKVILALCLLVAGASATETFYRSSFLFAASTEDKWSPPWFCHDADCPKYDVKSETDAYEVRDYDRGE